MKKSFSIVIVTLVVMFTFAFIAGNSFAMPNNDIDKDLNLELLKNDNVDELKKEILEYIDLVDNNLIPNASFNMSLELNKNYDFLTKFAISFILDNSDYYDIVVGDMYIYNNEYGVRYSTNEYISVDTIYEITSRVFGVDYYYILNDYLELNDDLVPLLEIDEHSFDMEIKDITSINDMGNYIDVVVKYEGMNLDYVYRFDLFNDRLVISNLTVEE